MTGDQLKKLCDSQRGDDKTRGRRAKFLRALASNKGVLSKAAKAAGISRRTPYNWQRECKIFADAFLAIIEDTDMPPADQPEPEPEQVNTDSHDDDIVPDYRKQLNEICKDIKAGDDQRRTVKAKRRFLRSLHANGGHVTSAARQIGKSPRTIRHWRQNDPKFVELMREVEEILYAEYSAEVVGEFMRGNTTAMKEVSKGLLGWTGEPKHQITINNNQAVLNPDKPEAEKLLRAREVMEAIGFSVSDPVVIEGEVNQRKIEHK